MTVRINKDAINLREKLSQLDKPSGLVGEELLRADTSADAREALNLEEHLFEDFESTGIDDNATSTVVTVSDSGVDVTGNLSFGDGDKATFGASDDLQIYHSGTNSFISEIGTGDLRIRSNKIRMEAPDSQNMIIVTEDAGVQAFYNGTERLSVTPTGVDVTGTVTADGLTVDGNTKLSNTGGTTLRLEGSGAVADNLLGRIKAETSQALNGDNPASIKFMSAGTLSGYHGGRIQLHTSNKDATGELLRLNVSEKGDISFYEDTGTTAKFVWDASAESLGIGTSSPSGALDIGGQHVLNDNYDAIGATFRRNGTYGSVIALGRQGVSDGATLDYPAASTLGLSTNGSERARIDSSGNLLVGTTSTNAELYNGARVFANGEISGTRAGSRAGYFNRKTNDGVIVDFAKDGLKVGSVNTNTGSISLNSSGSNMVLSASGVGFQFDSTTIRPFSGNDASVDLGTATTRFKDLYLSGGVYLGGTGAANKLDDYEEGTWTPEAHRSVGGEISATYTSQVGKYTKIGNTVYFEVYMVLSAVTSQGSGYTLIRGMPFIPAGATAYSTICQLQGDAIDSASVITRAYPSSNALYVGVDDNTAFPPRQYDWKAGSVRISGTYITSQ